MNWRINSTLPANDDSAKLLEPVGDVAKHRANEPVEQIDGLVSQIGDQVERNGDQGRMTALTFVAGDMLYRVVRPASRASWARRP